MISVVLVLLLQFLVSQGARPRTDSELGLTGLLVFVNFTHFLPLIAIAFFAALRAGSLANRITSGSPPPAAGLAGRIR